MHKKRKIPTQFFCDDCSASGAFSASGFYCLWLETIFLLSSLYSCSKLCISVWIWFDLTIKTLTHVSFRTAWLTKHLKVTFKTSLQKPWKPFYESGNNFNTDIVGGTAVLAWKLGRPHLI